MSQPSHGRPTATATAPLLVVSRFRGTADRAGFVAAAAEAVAALGEQPGCRSVAVGQSTDDPDLMVLRSEWDSVGAYRRALSAYDVKVRAVPLLSLAIDEPSAFELVREWTPEGVVSAAGGLAADAGSVGLGAAAAAIVPSITPEA